MKKGQRTARKRSDSKEAQMAEGENPSLGQSDWDQVLQGYKKEFINDQIRFQGWEKSSEKHWIREAWVSIENGKLALVHGTADSHEGALRAFQFFNGVSWGMPVPLRIQLGERLRIKRSEATSACERVRDLIKEQQANFQPVTPAKKPRNTQAEIKREIAQQAARNLEMFCEDIPDNDPAWNAVEAAVRMGRRMLLAEIFADEEAMSAGLHGQRMSRRGKSSKGRKRPEIMANSDRLIVERFVEARFQRGETDSQIKNSVFSDLTKNGWLKSGQGIRTEWRSPGTSAAWKQDTVQNWIRDHLRKTRKA